MRPFARLYFHPASFCGGLRLRFRRGRAFRRQNLHRAVLPRNPRADRLLKKRGGHIDDVPQRDHVAKGRAAHSGGYAPDHAGGRRLCARRVF